MKLALYYPWVYLTSGAERSILELVKRSRHDWTIFTNHYDSEHTYPGFGECRVVELDRVPIDRSFLKVMKATAKIASQRLDMDGFDALLVVCEGIGDMTVFRNHSKPVYCLCLTPLRPVFDEQYRESYLKDKGLAARLKLLMFACVFAALDRIAWRYYRHILCISRECYRRVVRGRLAGEDRLGLAFPGINYSMFRSTGRREKYFLLPGRIMWTKNIELGIEAFKRFRRECSAARDFRLIITGIVDKKSETYYAGLRELVGGDDTVEFIAHPSDEQLFDLYDRCYAVLFTAFNEDWGMVPLEGMAYGKPVVAVGRGGPLETVEHGKNGFLAEPTPGDFARYMAKLALAPEMAHDMGEYGHRYVERFDWKYFVQAVDEMIEGSAG